MSWLFSQALVAEYSADICLDGQLSAPSNGNPMQQAYLSHGKTTAFSRLSRFGMTCKPLTDTHGEALLTSYLADFRARTSAPLGGEKASKVSAVECGSTWPVSSVKYCLDSSSWKTAHCLWEEDLLWSSVTLPTWGMTRNGFVYQHPTAARPINATGVGSSAYGMGLTIKPTHSIPTPTASDHIERQSTSKETLNFETNKTVSLDRWVKHWPTPTVCGNHNRKGLSKTSSDGLATAVRRWPTPVRSMAKGSSPGALTRKDGQDRSNDRLDHVVMASDGGQLNPTWVEWLMGWPLGWTDLKPLAMARFREWRQQHSLCFLETTEKS